MTGHWTRRRVLQTAIAAIPLLAGCTVSGSVQQQQLSAIANATPTSTAGASPTAVPTLAASPSAAPTVPPTVTPGGMTALRLGAVGSEAEIDVYRTVTASYARVTPHTTVTVEPLGGSSSSLAAALAGGSAPDLVTIPWDQLAGLSARGFLDDLTPLLGANKLDLSGLASPLTAFATINGQTTALPLSYNPQVLYVNLDRFTGAGLPAPGLTFDWSAFEAAASKLSSGPEQSGFAASTAPFAWFPWVWAAGGSVFDHELTPGSCTLNDAAASAGLQRYADLWLKQRDAQPPGSDALAQFVSGKVAMVAGDRSSLASLKAATFKWQVTYLPQGPGGHATTYAATLLAVTRASRQPLPASAFAGFLATDRTAQGLLARTGVVVPALRAAAESADFPFSGAAIDDAVFYRTLLFADQPPRTAAWAQVQSAWNPDLGKVWSGEQSATAAAKSLAPKVDAALKQVAATPTVQPVTVQPPPPTPTAPAARPAGTPTVKP